MSRRLDSGQSPAAAKSARERTSDRAPLTDPVNDARTAQNDHPLAPQPSPAPVRDPWLEACIAHHHDTLMRKLRRIVGEHDAEDAMQEVFARFSRFPAKLRALKPDDPEVRRYLLVAAVNQAINLLRAQGSDKARIQVAALRGLLPVDLSQATERDATLYWRLDCEDEQDADRQKAVAAALDRLPDAQRSALVARCLDGVAAATVRKPTVAYSPQCDPPAESRLDSPESRSGGRIPAPSGMRMRYSPQC